MDLELYFLIEVIEKYEIDKMLKPVNLGDGELENVSLSDLRKRLDFSYAEISDSITFKESLLGYLEDYLVDLRAVHIFSQKTILKGVKREIKKHKKKHPDLNSNLEKDESIIDELSVYLWRLEQENYILHYLKEQSFFIRDWVSEKRKEDKDDFFKELIHKKERKEFIGAFLKGRKIKKIKKFKWHILIEPVVSGKISDIQQKAQEELTKTEFSRRIIDKLNLDIRIEDIAPYIQYSFIDDQDNPKNLFSKNKVIAIYKYCEEKNIKIIDSVFLKKIKEYIN